MVMLSRSSGSAPIEGLFGAAMLSTIEGTGCSAKR